MVEEPALDPAVEALRHGGVIAYPTEAVFGLGCDPGDADALGRLLALKQRPADKGLILIAADEDQLAPWLAPIEPALARRVRPTWPGATTWLLPAAPDCPALLSGGHDTLAVRVTDHPVAAALCRTWGGALVSTSANRSGGEPARDADGARALFGGAVDAVVDAPVGARERPSVIRDARTGATLRE